MYLAIRTEQKEASVFLIEKGEVVADKTWEAHRTLSDTLLKTIEEILNSKNKAWSDLEGIIIYKGPGSFTGLRIGTTVANTLAQALNIPIVGATSDDWIVAGTARLKGNENEKIVAPDYGGEANITKPRK